MCEEKSYVGSTVEWRVVIAVGDYLPATTPIHNNDSSNSKSGENHEENIVNIAYLKNAFHKKPQHQNIKMLKN